MVQIHINNLPNSNLGKFGFSSNIAQNHLPLAKKIDNYFAGGRYLFRGREIIISREDLLFRGREIIISREGDTYFAAGR